MLIKDKKMTGPQVPACDIVHREKYRGENENHREACNRIASANQDSHEHYMETRDALLNLRYLPAGRIQSASGSLKNVTAFNCFVMPTIHDSFTDGPDKSEIIDPRSWQSLSIMDTATMAAKTMRQGGGVGYDFSTLRPKGDIIRGVQSTTDGPMAFLPIFDAICRATSSAGNRRGAQMAVMRIDHPDIESFIRAKQVMDQSVPYDMRPLRGFNMSIAVTDEFMECLSSGRSFPLKFGGIVYRHVDPLALWEMVMRGTYDWAEPGVIFIDTVNRMNNLWYCETIAATNPCGEQPLPPYGACLLGSINLPKYLISDIPGVYHFDYDLLAHDIPNIVRMMDNVIDRTRYPLSQQRLEAQRKRRMGIGVTGMANAIEAMGAPYGSQEFLMIEDEILSFITRNLYRASALLAKEKGSFPMFDLDSYMKSAFISSLDDDTKDMIRKYGIRNSHLTSIAPTGTISFCADNVSSSIEPVFGYEQKRRIIFPDGPREVIVPDYGFASLGVRGKLTADVTADEHVAVLCTAQLHVDSAVSKTCNVPSKYPYEDFKKIYARAYENGAKGCTTYRPNGNYDEVVKAVDTTAKVEDVDMKDGEACSWDPITGQRTGACAE